MRGFWGVGSSRRRQIVAWLHGLVAPPSKASWEQGGHHSTDPRTAEIADCLRHLGACALEERQSEAPLKRLVIYYGIETRIARSMYEGCWGGGSKTPIFRGFVVD